MPSVPGTVEVKSTPRRVSFSKLEEDKEEELLISPKGLSHGLRSPVRGTGSKYATEEVSCSPLETQRIHVLCLEEAL